MMRHSASPAICRLRLISLGISAPTPMDIQPTDTGLLAVFTDHRAALARFLRARGAAGDAEDLLQDMWLKLQSLEHGPIAEPLAYLYRMADNQLLDRYRENGRRTRRETIWGEISSASPTNAEEMLLAREGLAAVNETLGALGERTHSILYRFRVDGQSQKDIARELGVSLSLVEKHLQRAYRALLAVKARLQGDDDHITPDAAPDSADV
jgi:RNA polymerase sigma-70 factor (ECF subfamily)